jgi:hypothetical protein
LSNLAQGPLVHRAFPKGNFHDSHGRSSDLQYGVSDRALCNLSGCRACAPPNVRGRFAGARSSLGVGQLRRTLSGMVREPVWWMSAGGPEYIERMRPRGALTKHIRHGSSGSVRAPRLLCLRDRYGELQQRACIDDVEPRMMEAGASADGKPKDAARYAGRDNTVFRTGTSSS